VIYAAEKNRLRKGTFLNDVTQKARFLEPPPPKIWSPFINYSKFNSPITIGWSKGRQRQDSVAYQDEDIHPHLWKK